jgi:hypothetical protein
VTRLGALVGFLLAGCAMREPSIADAGHDGAVVAREPTWRSTIEPMFARHCTGCHSDGALAPVDLRSMETVRSLGRLIASLLRERVMPPLAPRAGLASIDDHRALPDAEIAQFERWIALGGPEGAENAAVSAFARPSNRDPLPAAADLVVTPATAWTAPADRDDAHQCFVTPQTLERDRRLVGVRISPGDAATVHRVVLYAVHGEDATRVQALDPSQQGFECFSRLRAAQEEWSSRPLPVLSTQQLVGWTPMPDRLSALDWV